MNDLNDQQAEQIGKQLADLLLLKRHHGQYKTAVGNLSELELARTIIKYIDDMHDKHIVFTVHTGVIRFRDSLNRTGSTPVFTTVADAIESTKSTLQIDDSWSIEIIG